MLPDRPALSPAIRDLPRSLLTEQQLALVVGGSAGADVNIDDDGHELQLDVPVVVTWSVGLSY